MRKSIVSMMGAVALASWLAGPATKAQAPAPVKIGVVDQERVLNESIEGKRLTLELQKLREEKMAAIGAKEKEINGLQDQLLSTQFSLSQEKRDTISRQLKRKRVEYERLNDDSSADFQDAANRAQAKLIGVFRDIVTKYGTEKGFTIIFERGTVYFASEKVDVTDEMLARFNAATPPGAVSKPRS